MFIKTGEGKFARWNTSQNPLNYGKAFDCGDCPAKFVKKRTIFHHKRKTGHSFGSFVHRTEQVIRLSTNTKSKKKLSLYHCVHGENIVVSV
jgi:hypothetical protein